VGKGAFMSLPLAICAAPG